MTRDARERLLLLAAGASVAIAALLLLGPGARRRTGSEARPVQEPDIPRRPGPGGPAAAGPVPAPPAWKTFGDGLRDEWSEWMERRAPAEVDPALLRSRLAELPAGGEVQVGVLAPGIVELVGTVPGPDESRALLAAAAGEPGVRRVVNRLWIEGDVE